MTVNAHNVSNLYCYCNSSFYSSKIYHNGDKVGTAFNMAYNNKIISRTTAILCFISFNFCCDKFPKTGW